VLESWYTTEVFSTCVTNATGCSAVVKETRPSDRPPNAEYKLPTPPGVTAKKAPNVLFHWALVLDCSIVGEASMPYTALDEASMAGRSLVR